jgi:hypothetical protein
MPAIANAGKNWFAFINWARERFEIKFALPRKAFGVSVFDDERLTHSAIGATDAGFGFVHFDAPNMPATVTYRFIIFHAIILVCLY